MNPVAFIDAALDEDMPSGDATSLATLEAAWRGEGRVLAKEDLVISGSDLATLALERAALRVGGDVQVALHVEDGTRVAAGTVVANVRGSFAALLAGERLALNVWMHLSGVATQTAKHVAAAGPHGPSVLDTRKTTPLHRPWEKRAVLHGGGRNHRTNLSDGILIKDNHVDAVGDLGEAVRRARQRAHHLLRIEVEVRRLEEVDVALEAGADALLLDNFSNEELAVAVARARAIQPGVYLEASGGMTAERIASLRSIGLDAISVGGLIHQARWVDLSMKVARLR